MRDLNFRTTSLKNRSSSRGTMNRKSIREAEEGVAVQDIGEENVDLEEADIEEEGIRTEVDISRITRLMYEFKTR